MTAGAAPHGGAARRMNGAACRMNGAACAPNELR
jgi:hypothetical protein